MTIIDNNADIPNEVNHVPSSNLETLFKMKQELEQELQECIQRFTNESGLIVTWLDCSYDTINGRIIYEVESQASLV